MCGILGLAGEAALKYRTRFDVALDLLQHRGPDDRGVHEEPGVIMGHRRLSILDLSSAGHQPMVDQASGAVVVFNGEIYNYVELRTELEAKGHAFKSRTDTEVLLRAYLTWGDDCLGRLNGMWAFAIWLPKQQRLFFARDRFGVKPFYYYSSPELFSFASEPKALISLQPELGLVDDSALYRFLALGDLYTEGVSFHRGIRVLPAAFCGEFIADTGRCRLWRYWNYPDSSLACEDLGRTSAEFSALFDDAVRIRLRSDVPVGFTLSGGLDSTAILAAAMRTRTGERHCFTSVYGSDNRGEAEWAVRASRPYGIKPVEVEATATDWIDVLARITWHMDGPGYSPAVYALWCLMAEARRQGVPVILEGQGADEALGGYPQYGVIGLLSGLGQVILHPDSGKLEALRRSWSGLAGTFTALWVLRWMMRISFPFLVPLYRRRVGALSVLRPEFVEQASTESSASVDAPKQMDAITHRLWQDHSRNVLPGLLHYGDAISMAHSIESRLPFLDYRLVEWLFARNANIKIREGTTKWVLRQYLGMVGQGGIAARPDKLGYPTPADQWMRGDNGSMLRDILLSRDAKVNTYCEPGRIRRLIDHHVRGGSGAGNHLYRLLTTELWLRQNSERHV